MSSLLLFPEPGPRLFNAPAGLPFPDALASGVLQRLRDAGAGPEALADVEIVVSTQRAVRALRSAFVRAAGGVVLGPRLRTLGDIGSDVAAPCDAPPAIDGARRLLILTRLVRALLEKEPILGAPTVAAPLAADLAALLDSAQSAGVSLDGLDALSSGEHAAHWALSRRFLEIIRDLWPGLLAVENRIDPEDRRRRVVAAYADAWAADPPLRPVIVAGSTGSLDTSAQFIELVSHLPQGAIVLPGLDDQMDAPAAAELVEGRAPEHPQAGLYALCHRIGVAPRDVPPWAPDPRPHAGPRLFWLSQAMRPAPVTDAWLTAADRLAADAAAATQELTLIEAATPRDEAAAISLVLREALETPGRRAALITPDRTLARRVASELARWGVEPDDSGGRPLSLTAPGVFFSLAAEAALSQLAPAPLLALLKHPMCSAGFHRGAHLRLVRAFERHILRADRLAAGRDYAAAITDLEARRRPALEEEPPPVAPSAEGGTDETDPTLLDWWRQVSELLSPLLLAMAPDPDAPQTIELEELLARHEDTAVALSRRAEQEAPELYQRAAGETLAVFLSKLRAAADGFGPIAPKEYPTLLGQLMAGEAVREAFGRHPRIAILGPLEARMQTADLVVLAGLNDGVWPQPPEPDPWISRDMRRTLGLPPLESRIGLSAHDFFQAAMATTAVLTRSRRSDGAPTVPSRWLLRLSTLMNGVAPGALAEMRARGDRYLALARRLDTPSEALLEADRARLAPAARPRPAPPADARPRRISATEVETLIRDPYAVYARRVLRLAPLAELAEAPDQRDRGDILHAIVERYVDQTMAGEPDDPAALYNAIVEQTLAPIVAWPTAHALWSARAHQVRDWFLVEEAKRRRDGAPIALEAVGSLATPTINGPVALTAKADRIDRLNTGDYVIYDYKTGGLPSKKEIDHFAKQMPLEAAVLIGAGFEGAPRGPVASFGYLRLKGGRDGGVQQLYEDAADRAEEALVGLAQLLARYADSDQPYLARARPQFLRYEGDYDHLARYGEWVEGA